jgi:prepilin-type processing-associated H-X9-DG protein
MKSYGSKQGTQAWTLPELLVVIASLVVLAALLLPVLAATRRRSARIGCVSNVKQLNLAFRIWESDSNDKYPMSVSVTNDGGMELIATGNIAGCLLVMSNQLATPKILVCPEDTSRSPATNFWNGFNNSHISYFVNPDADESYPQLIMTGDANLTTNGVAVKSGMLALSPEASVSWTTARHAGCGNIGYADGSVAEVSPVGLQSSLILATNGTPTMTNRLAIP